MPATIQIAKSGARNAPTLPLDAVTRTFGIFGMKDSGKTNTGRVVTEGVVKVGGNAAAVSSSVLLSDNSVIVCGDSLPERRR